MQDNDYNFSMQCLSRDQSTRMGTVQQHCPLKACLFNLRCTCHIPPTPDTQVRNVNIYLKMALCMPLILLGTIRPCMLLLDLFLFLFKIKLISLWWRMLDFSNHFVCLNPAPFWQSTVSSHSDLPSSIQPMDRLDYIFFPLCMIPHLCWF